MSWEDAESVRCSKVLCIAGPDQETSRHWPDQKNRQPEGIENILTFISDGDFLMFFDIQCFFETLINQSGQAGADDVKKHKWFKGVDWEDVYYRFRHQHQAPSIYTFITEYRISSVSSDHSSENWSRHWCQSWNTRATRPTSTTTLRTTWTKLPVSVKGSRGSLMTFDHFVSGDCVRSNLLSVETWGSSKMSWYYGRLHKCYFHLAHFLSADIFFQLQQMYFYKLCKHISECSAGIFLQGFLCVICAPQLKNLKYEQYETLNKWHQFSLQS